MGEGNQQSPEGGEPGLGALLGPKLMTAMRIAREVLPGDSRYGDPLSTTGTQPRALVARRLGDAAKRRPGILKEAGLSALQVWEAVSEPDGVRLGDDRLAIVFTDLVGFSEWALEAGDDLSLELLREVAGAIEIPVTEHDGEVVKRLGDGMMAVFADPTAAARAIAIANENLSRIEVGGYAPRMRAGMHVGLPRRIADDYLGVDVNIAARIAESASAGELLVSGDALAELDADEFKSRRKLVFRAKGVPRDVDAYSLRPR